MKIYDALSLARTAVATQSGRPATILVHDSPEARVVLFRIEPGQEVAVHTSASTVLLTVLAGSGVVCGANGDQQVKAGEIVAYDEHEPHGMRASSEQLVLAAVIAPRPGTR